MARADCRDWLCYLHSTLLPLARNGLLDEAAAIWRIYFERLPDRHAAVLSRTLRYIYWMRRLKNRRWGRDPLQLAALAEFSAVSGMMQRR
ncbi:hypothetical protein [Neisseria musculi]|uniref:hypothetical protein n=1 Tax=Neisseria musculi TaxID=1815583 RepID=UPI001FE38F6D|nr:hypothetical protein [Neisseria musculi]